MNYETVIIINRRTKRIKVTSWTYPGRNRHEQVIHVYDSKPIYPFGAVSESQGPKKKGKGVAHDGT